MDLVTNWKIHLSALIIIIIADAIGTIKLGIVVLLPLLYALLMGAVVSYPALKLLNLKEMERAGAFMPIALLLLIAKIGLDIGPNLHLLMKSGGALLFQEVGHFVGTILFGLPLAIALKLGREAIGACYSIDREANVAIIIERFGMSSPEARGVMGMYICGTVFGAAWISVLASVIARMDLFHPYALAMGAGVGSASMMAAATGSIVAVYPAMEEQIRAMAAAANLMTTILGIYFSLFISLPVTIKLYEWATGDKGTAKKEEVA